MAEPSGAMRRLPSIKEHNRPELLRIAASLLAEKGVEGTTLQAIADAAGINRSSIYYYFPSKDSVVDTLFEEYAQSASKSYEEIPSSAGHTVAARLSGALQGLTRWVLREQTLIRAFDRNADALPKPMAKRLDAIKRQGFAAMSAILSEGVKAGEFEIDNVSVVAFALIGMCTWIAWWYSPSGSLGPAELSRLIAQLGLRTVVARGAGENTDALRNQALGIRAAADQLLQSLAPRQEPQASKSPRRKS
jgi:AcrR family transcriptional regulator